jgi:hypothetical protein
VRAGTAGGRSARAVVAGLLIALMLGGLVAVGVIACIDES